ncbi:MAG: YfiR family protein [Terracidiphilus sp.]
MRVRILSEPARKRPGSKAAAKLHRAAAALLMTLSVACVFGQARPTEYDVKAAYLFNFGQFMHLSAGSDALRRTTFDICILGRDPIGRTIDQIAANATIGGRAVRILRVADPSQARTCAIVFVSAQEGDRIREDLAILSGSDALTVSDGPDFLRRGGMIQFVIQQDRVRFDVNLNAVSRTHLVLSSELLRVAAAVVGSPPPEVKP